MNERLNQTPGDEMKDLMERLVAAEKPLYDMLRENGDKITSRSQADELLREAGRRVSQYHGWTAAEELSEAQEYKANVPELLRRMGQEKLWLEEQIRNKLRADKAPES